MLNNVRIVGFVVAALWHRIVETGPELHCSKMPS